MMENPSEIAQLRQRIADEYQAARWGLTGLAYGTSQHQFISIRMDNMGKPFEEVTRVVGSPEVAAQVIVDLLESLPDTPKQSSIVALLQRKWDNSEETANLIEHIQEAWKTNDLLGARFGPEQARNILTVPLSDISEKEEASDE